MPSKKHLSPHTVTTADDKVMVALVSYNVGIVNDEIAEPRWHAKNGWFYKLQEDVRKIFEDRHGIEIVLVSEFGSMETKVCEERARKIINKILHRLELPHI